MTKKRLLLFSLCLLAFLETFSQARTLVKINPLSLFLFTANVQGERALNDRFSAQLGVFVGQTTINVDENGADKIRYGSFGITPELRYHATFATKDCPEGLYFAPYFRFRSIRQSYEGEIFDPDLVAQSGNIVFRRNSFGGGVLLGYEFITQKRFVLDAFIGPQFSRTKSMAAVSCLECDGDETFKTSGFDFTGIEVRAGLALGYAF
jgi:hypothetical protein